MEEFGTGLLAPGVSRVGPRSVHKRPIDAGTFFAPLACLFRRPLGLADKRLSVAGSCAKRLCVAAELEIPAQFHLDFALVCAISPVRLV